MPNDFPAWRFGPNGASVIVMSQEEADCLPGGWSMTVPEGWQSVPQPTYKTVAHVPHPVDVEKIADEVKRRPGRPRKAE